MNIGSQSVNPYLYTLGGNIVGDYMYLGATKIRMKNTADIEMALEECRLQLDSDRENYLCFKDDKIYINKGLEVKGDLDVDGSVELQSLHVHKDLTVDGTLYGNIAIFTANVSGLSGIFGSISSGTSSVGHCTAISLYSPIATITTLTNTTLNGNEINADMINATGQVACNVLDAAQNIRAGGNVTTDTLLVAGLATCHDILCYEFTCQNSFPRRHAVFHGSVDVYETLAVRSICKD